MATLINSGIIFLETFVDNVHLLPADLSRQLGYIRSLDEKIQETKASVNDHLAQFVATWQHAGHPLPQEAHDQRMGIDALHADIIHYQEEKNVFASQLEDMLRSKAEDLLELKQKLGSELALSAPLESMMPPQAGGSSSQLGGSVMDFNMSYHSDAPQPQQSGQSIMISIPKGPKASKGTRRSPAGTPINSMPGSVPMPQPSHPSRTPTPPGPMHHAHAPGHPGMSMPGHMMSQYLAPSGGGAPHGMYGYQGHHMGMVPGMEHHHHHPGMHMAGGGQVQYFCPVDPSMQAASEKPQARSGRVLTLGDITPALVGRQAELLWPDDGMWYLIKITAVDPVRRTADIMYITGETENGLNMEEIALKKELRIVPG